MQTYYEISDASEGFLKDRGSRFLAFAFPVHKQEEIELHIADIRKRFHDARHHCVAWRLGREGEETYTNDDGEPSHSAGAPILAAIRSASLTNVLVVVVRYFGGTKLGVRGLIEAYRNSAADALAQVEKKAIIPKVIFTLEFAYERTSDVNRILHRYETDVLEAEYTDICRQVLSIREGFFSALEAQLRLAQFELKNVVYSAET
ncbi:MAG: YigZ family protein [Bacteroidota bacterium]